MISKMITPLFFLKSDNRFKKINFKTTSIALVAVFFISISSFSQVKFGVKGGLNLADICQGVKFSGQSTIENGTTNSNGSGTSTSQTTTQSFSQTLQVDTTPLISFYVGGYAETKINKKGNLFLRLELLFSQNGANVDAKEADLNQNLSYSSNGGKYIVNQLNMPILLKFTTNKKIALIGGCYFGTILSAKFNNNNGISTNVKPLLKQYDFGLSIGASYPIQKKLTVELMYNRGMTNLDPYKQNTPDFEVQGEFYNRTVHIGVAYLFH